MGTPIFGGPGGYPGCCRGAMWVPCRVGGYPGKTRFLVRPRVQESWGGGRSDHG